MSSEFVHPAVQCVAPVQPLPPSTSSGNPPRTLRLLVCTFTRKKSQGTQSRRWRTDKNVSGTERAENGGPFAAERGDGGAQKGVTSSTEWVATTGPWRAADQP